MAFGSSQGPRKRPEERDAGIPQRGNGGGSPRSLPRGPLAEPRAVAGGASQEPSAALAVCPIGGPITAMGPGAAGQGGEPGARLSVSQAGWDQSVNLSSCVPPAPSPPSTRLLHPAPEVRAKCHWSRGPSPFCATGGDGGTRCGRAGDRETQRTPASDPPHAAEGGESPTGPASLTGGKNLPEPRRGDQLDSGRVSKNQPAQPLPERERRSEPRRAQPQARPPPMLCRKEIKTSQNTRG